MEKNGDYYIGLDCGTESVGWAVTDTEYNLLKFRRKNMWGAHLFDEAKTAKDRRIARCSRRRYMRKKERIDLTQEIFAEEIAKIDPEFFIRLNDSGYLADDKTCNQKNSLFNDEDYKDKDFFKDYPTIFHLRAALMNRTAKKDPRLVYLAIHHIMKNRGHFLFSVGDDIASIMNIDLILQEIQEVFTDIYEEESFEILDTKSVETALLEKRSADKKGKLAISIKASDKKLKDIIINLILGNKIKADALFSNEAYADLSQIEFKNASFEESAMPILEATLTAEEYRFIELCKGLYDWSILSKVLQGTLSISEAKVAQFDKNKEDLKTLKAIIRQYAPDEYEKYFHSSDGTFSKYIGKVHSKNGKHISVRRLSYADFCKNTKALLSKFPEDDARVKYILNSIEDNLFFPLLISSENSVLPYQLHLYELTSIIDYASSFLPFLKEMDNDGFTGKQKLIDIFKFRVPYYVGPIGKCPSNQNSWAKRKEGKVLPWNFFDMIDEDASAERFIRRMTNKCVYFPDQDVIPKNSLLYSKYMVLNELNNLRINGDKLPPEKKQELYHNLFETQKTVTQNKLKRYIINNGWFDNKDEITISGIDGDFKANLSSYILFKPYLESKKLSKDEVEQIIKWLTLFSDGGTIARRKIESSTFKDNLSNEDIKKISTFKFSGWGRFSEKFLKGIKGMNKETGEIDTIIGFLWNTNNYLMELLSKNYDFEEQTKNKTKIDKISYSVVDDLYVSPSVKRQIWQTLRIVDEIEHIIGYPPKKVFIEVARGEQEKKRTISRKNDLLSKMKTLDDNDKKILLELGKGNSAEDVQRDLEKTSESIISKRDKLYLYYSQLGRCMYSGKHIEISDLDNVKIYDIDHIYPYSKSDDDSLTNKVLVCKNYNSEKSDDYPIKEEIRSKMTPFWKILLKRNLINQEKYNRLTRHTPLSDSDLQGFVNRQLVETAQNTKATADILKRYFGEETKIVYSKARKVSYFRKEFEIWKSRSINNLHHAKDAYLNIVVGNVLDTKYTNNFWSHRMVEGYQNISKPFEHDVQNAWVAKNDDNLGSLQTVYNTLLSTTMEKTILCTRQTIKRKGVLFDLMLVSKGSKEGALPAKSSDPLFKKLLSECSSEREANDIWTRKYGGYNSLKVSHFALVKHLSGKKDVVSFIPINVIDSKKLTSAKSIESYCTVELGLKNPKTIRNEVLINTKLVIDGYPFRIKGKDSGGANISLENAFPLIIGNDDTLSFKAIENLVQRIDKDRNYEVNELFDNVSSANNARLFKLLLQKAGMEKMNNRPANQMKILKDAQPIFDKLDIKDQCRALAYMLPYFAMGSGKADFTLIKGRKDGGFLRTSSKIEPSKKSLILIDESITGLFSKETVIKI